MRAQLAPTARAAAYVLSCGPIAVALLVLLPLGFGLGIGLMPAFLLGVPVAGATVLGWKGLAVLERRRAALVLDAPIPAPPAPAERPSTLGARWRARLTDPMTWKELGWAISLATLGLAAASILLALLSAILAGLMLPVFVAVAPPGSTPHGWPAALLGPVGAVAALALAALAARGLGAGLGMLAGALLAPDESALLAARVQTLETTRAGAVDSADATLRRIERDLHDGAQHRLAYVAMELGRARGKLDEDPEAARVLVEKAHEESKRAMAELRDLVRGVHPSVLEDRGLAAAVPGLAGRSGVPVSTRVEVEPRPGRAAETAAYFVVAEALANLGRHSEATAASVEVVREGAWLVVTVDDDGRGGASAQPGGGLAGLAQRVVALDGTFMVISNPGEGTMIRAELPCGS